MDNCVELMIDKSLSFIAGEKIFKDQAAKKIDMSKQFYIVFPEHIILCASSFVQGFFSEIRKSVGMSDIIAVKTLEEAKQTDKRCVIIAKENTLIDSIMRNLV